MKVLLIEDSHSLQRSLGAGLRNSGFALDQAYDGIEAQSHLAATTYDVIILDLMIPGIDGLTLLSQMRSRGDKTFVLILSAKDTTEDRIKGLDIGADDYLVKPFAFDELLSRLRALTRRARTGEQPVNSFMQVGELTINTAERTVWRDKIQASLTPYEYGILELLARRRGQVFTHDQMIDRVYGVDHSVTRNAIEAHISSLRRKLRDIGVEEQVIQTRRGFGYYIAV